MYYVYVLQSEKGKKYIGYTQNMRERLEQHNAGKSAYTKGSKWELIYFEGYRTEAQARRRERSINCK